jgi:hypothetical protein
VAVFEVVRDDAAELIVIRQIAIDADGNVRQLLRVPRGRARRFDGTSYRSDRSTTRLLCVGVGDRVRVLRDPNRTVSRSTSGHRRHKSMELLVCQPRGARNRHQREDRRSTFGCTARPVASLSSPLPSYPADRRARWARTPTIGALRRRCGSRPDRAWCRDIRRRSDLGRSHR